MAQNFLKNHKVHLRGPVGSIEGPRLVLDPMEVRSYHLDEYHKNLNFHLNVHLNAPPINQLYKCSSITLS